MNIEILPYQAGIEYLGRQKTFDKPHGTEVESRIRAAWKKLHVLKAELTTVTKHIRCEQVTAVRRDCNAHCFIWARSLDDDSNKDH